MRKHILLVLLVGSGVALGGSHGGGSFRGGRGSGLSVHYGHTSGHSSFSLHFGGGTWNYGSGGWYSGWPSRAYYPGSYGSTWRYGSGGWYSGWPSRGYYPGSYGSGVYIYGGWTPYTLYGYAPYPGTSYLGDFGPYTYTGGAVFSNTPGVSVFGHEQRVAVAAAAAEKPAATADDRNLSTTGLIDRGDEFFIRGDFARAVDAYRAAARKDASDPMAALALGHGLFATGAYGEAAAELRRGVRLYPGILQVRMSRRDFYGDPAAFDAQLEALARQVQASPSDAAARFLLGYNCFFTQQHTRAEEQFVALGSADPEAQLFLREIRRSR
jgi:tetratricopeptide (TPR) repeat protein